MISISLLLLGICQLVCAAPTNVTNGVFEAELFTRNANNGPSRTLFSIVYGCVSTIILCAWTSVHPPVPVQGRSMRTTRRRLEIMFGAIMAPSILPVAAFGHYWGARRARDLYNKRERANGDVWTLRHGFFLVMGGFQVTESREKGNPTPFVLSLATLEELCKNPDFEIPVKEEEIVDKSKSDGLSKLIFMIQSSWFIIQCIIRQYQRLGLTALELTTGAIAILNIIAFSFWWYKPLAVDLPLRVQLNVRLPDKWKDEDGGRYDSQFPKGFRADILKGDVVTKLKNAFLFREGIFVSAGTWLLSPILILSVLLIIGISHGADIFMASSFPYTETHVPSNYVPRVWPPLRHFMIQSSLLSILTIALGGIHCLGWNMGFPTHIEQLLWRYSSLSAAVSPFILLSILVTPLAALYVAEDAFNVIRYIHNRELAGLPRNIFRYISDPRRPLTGLPQIWREEVDKLRKHHGPESVIPTGLRILATAGTVVDVTCGFVYLVSTLVLVGLAVAQLRDLPPNVFLPLKWSEFYPHL